MHKVNGFVVFLCLALALGACASLGLAPASSFEDKLAYAVTQNAAVRTAAASSLDHGDIAVEDAKAVMKITDEVRGLIDAARVASGAGDLSTAEARLSLATQILVKLQAHLRSRA